MIEVLSQGGAVLAVIVKAAERRVDGVKFVTHVDDALQVAVMNHAAGREVRPHFHPTIVRTIYGTPEVLIIERGRVKLTLYDGDMRPEHVLETGDIVVLKSGGHGLTMLEDAEIIEVKQGPYAAERDKVLLTP